MGFVQLSSILVYRCTEARRVIRDEPSRTRRQPGVEMCDGDASKDALYT